MQHQNYTFSITIIRNQNETSKYNVISTECLTFQKPGNIDEDGNWEDIPESPEIQVVHEKATPPNLHGILKQRSMSESSDDYSNGSPCSPRDDPFGGRKSVSFNEHVDHALFKSTMSVSTMHKALKSKKKRNKKREGRRRKNSGGSEGSSSEETEVCGTRSKSSTSEESDENSDKLDEISEEDQGTDQQEAAKTSKQDLMVKNIMQKISKTSGENLEETVADSDDDIDVGDKVKQTKTKSKKGKSVQFGNTSNDENHERTSKCDKVNGGENEKRASECVDKNEIGSKSSENDANESDKMGKKDMNVDENLRKDESKTKVKKDQAKSDKSKSIDLKVSADDVISNSGIPSISEDVSLIKVAADKGEDSGVESTGEAPDQSLSNENETSLSWDDSIDVSNQDHKTNCAFDFSNAVIFDLDVD